MILPDRNRPTDFEEFLGNEDVVNSLIASVLDDTLSHALLFYGPSGCGKTTMAKIIGNHVNCSNIREINTGNNRGIDFVRGILSELKFGGGTRVYLFDEAHMLTTESSNALLTEIEKLRKHVYFIFCSTNPEKILKTIRNRCETYYFGPLKSIHIRKLVARVAEKEDITISSDIVNAVVDHCDGVPRVALNDLNKIRNVNSVSEAKELMIAMDESEDVGKFYKMLLFEKTDWKKISTALNKLKTEDPERLRIGLVNWIGRCLYNSRVAGDSQAFSSMLDCLDVFPLDGATGRSNLANLIWKVYNLAEKPIIQKRATESLRNSMG